MPATSLSLLQGHQHKKSHEQNSEAKNFSEEKFSEENSFLPEGNQREMNEYNLD